jgi:hypothetical protein
MAHYPWTSNPNGTFTPVTTQASPYTIEGTLDYIIHCNDAYLNTVYRGSAPPYPNTVSGPVGAPTIAAAAGSTNFLAGVYQVWYSTVTGGVETQVSPASSVTLTEGQQINVSAITGLSCDSVKYYASYIANSQYPAYATSTNVVSGTAAATSIVSVNVADYVNNEFKYGTRCGTYSDSGIVDLNGALAIADAYFNTTSYPLWRPPVTLLGSDVYGIPEIFRPGESVRLEGRDGQSLAPNAFSIARVKESIGSDGIFRCSLELEREYPDTSLTIQKIILQMMQKYGSQANSSNTSANPANSASSSGLVSKKLYQDEFTSAGLTTYTLSETPKSIVVYQLTGATQEKSTITSVSGNVITLNTAPPTGAHILFLYLA